MNPKAFVWRAALLCSLALLMGSGAGCKHAPARNTTPVTETQAPIVTSVARSADLSEKRLQDQIDLLREQIGILTARADALARFHGSQMDAKWMEKVQAARASGSRAAERMRYLDATKALLARKLQGLRDEVKVYEDFVASDPTIPRP